ncbi:MAG: DEAD/DEAH box helicase [Gordonia sp. (in: high G+C Gram-positive bacteria)]|uniref:DEAD/DEAH box helicase n=1 Tax=Gordonia sp. (in: high G+C Gram-positive bacteria) TaxID=84139 RepID=UPI003C7795E0
MSWPQPNDTLVQELSSYYEKCIEVYELDHDRVAEDAGKERGIAEGGYGRKQIQELIQNAADALIGVGGRIDVVLTEDCLYVANEGAPFSSSGLRALLYTHLSNKTGTEIGRFGLGFKSVSGISNNPQILSRSVSFEFNRQRSATELTTRLGTEIVEADSPALRLAWPIDHRSKIAGDPVLSELSWATTIVKLPLHPNASVELSSEISGFDESFSIFAPHVRELTLDDRTTDTHREFRTTTRGKRVTLQADGTSSEWLVFGLDHRPSPAALESAGYAASRETVRLSWAVPTTGGRDLGRLSAFFPVKSDLTLSGRVNAPWKLSDDRINVIECAFNEELLTKVLPQIVVDARQELIATGQYGRYIDVLPARGKEARSWADRVINEPIYNALRASRCLPDLDGTLHSATQLKSVPVGLETWTDRWLETTADRGKWVHPSCTSTVERRSKVDRLMNQAAGAAVGRIKHWIEGIVSPESASDAEIAKRSIEAVTLAAEIVAAWPTGPAAAKLPPAHKEIRDSQIVLLSTGQLQTPMPGRCFISPTSTASGGALIDMRVTDNKAARAALEIFGIGTFDDGSNLLQILQKVRDGRVPEWGNLWAALRSTDLETVRSGFANVLDNQAQRVLRVKGAEGKWVYPKGRFLPSKMRPNNTDSRFFVDGNYHRGDRDLLELLGVHDRPRPNLVHPRETWISDYRDYVVEAAGNRWNLGSQKRQEIQVDGTDHVLGPLCGLPEMNIDNRTALTELTLASINAPTATVTNPQTRATAQVLGPELWWIKKHGMLSTELGKLPIGMAFEPESNETSAVPAGFLPTATNLDASSKVLAMLGLRDDVNKLTLPILIAMQDAHVSRADGELVGVTYAWWCHLFADERPEKVAACVGADIDYRDVTDVTLVVSESEEQDLREFKIPFLRVPAEDVEQMSTCWGFERASDLPIEYEFDTSAELATFSDMFPGAAVDENPDVLDLKIQACSEIRKVARIPNKLAISVQTVHGMCDDVLLVTGSTDIERLANTLDAIGADCSPEQLELHELQMLDRRVKLKERGLRRFDSDAERLLDLIEEKHLKSLIVNDARPHLDQAALTGLSLAELCITLYGPSVLERACRVARDDMDLTPPERWGGSMKAREWVTYLGFPERWAGKRVREAVKPAEHVDGPANLEALHPYQDEVADKLTEVLVGTGLKRGIVMLPTGAGKTRVAVQTVATTISGGQLDGEDEFRGPVLWLADTEELCEQAVTTWANIWRGYGRTNTQLIISRFWGSHDLGEETESGAVQVVVASWQKLRRAINDPTYEWLRETPIVIIDEAHGAIHKSYTAILDWLHRGHASRDRTLIGLTATPFRGAGEDSEDSKRLRKRFDDNILTFTTETDSGQLKFLQDIKVLSHVTTKQLPGSDIRLTSKDTKWFRDTRTLPKQNENVLGQNEERTRTIVHSILDNPDDWSILVFATSVVNARVIATVLTAKGRPAASIDQDTPPNERRDIIDRFKKGELKVITNYGVLSQGFDAPHTNAVYVTRPTSSAVLYRQMVGRGMRGPKNGGTSEVLVVNVLDNIIRHEDALEEMEKQKVPSLPIEAIEEDFGENR